MPLLDVFWSMFMLFMWIVWFWLLISIFGDIFRSDDLGGGAKAAWTIFVIIVPFLGVLVYLIARGSSMQQRALDAAAVQAKAQQAYIQDVAGSSSTADELAKLSKLHSDGVLTDAEFASQKASVLN